MKGISKGIWIGGVVVFVAGVLMFLGPFAGCSPPGWRHGPFSPSFLREGTPLLEQGLSRARAETHGQACGGTETHRGPAAELRSPEDQAEGDLEAGKAKRTAWVGELRTELNKEEPDIQVLAANVKKATKAFPEAMDRHLDLFVEFYNILDETQKMKVVQRFRDRLGSSS